METVIAAGPGVLEPGEVAAVETLAEVLGFNPRGMFRTVNGRPEVTYRGRLVVDAIWKKALGREK